MRRAGALAAGGRGAQHDHAVLAADRVGLDHAAGVDDRVDHGAGGGRGELDPPAVRFDLAVVGDQRGERLAGLHVDHLRGDLVVDRERDQPVTVEVEREAVAGDERHRAERGGDGAGIAHARRHQGGEAAAGRGDASEVDDRGVRPARDVEVVPPGHEIGIGDVAGRSQEARGVDHGAGAEQHAVAVDDEDAAVGGDGAEDLRRPEPAGHPVEHHRRARGLVEAHALAGADVERVPVDDRAAGGRGDGDVGGAQARDAGGATDHRRTLRLGSARQHAERQQRRRGQQHLCETSAHRPRWSLLELSRHDEEESCARIGADELALSLIHI